MMYKFFQTMAFIVSLTLTSLCFSQTTAPKVSLQTNVGEIIIELNPKAAPVSTANFLSYVNESNNGLKNLKYTVAMARTRVPDSATSQFFINHKDNAFLDGQKGRPGYAVFGKVVKGMDTVEKIATTQTKNLERYGNVPVKTISIIKAVVVKDALAKPTVKPADKPPVKQSTQPAPVAKPKT